MIITCPNCLMRYNVDPIALGSGKTTRCSNCGHSWFQQPVSALPPIPAPQMPQQAPAPYPPGYPPPPQGYPAPPYPQQPAPAPYGQPVPPVAAPVPQPEPEPIPEPEPVPEPEPIPEPEPEPEPVPELEPEPEGDDDGGLTSEQLDEMFGEDDDSGGITSVAEDDNIDDDDLSDLGDLPDPDPIPQVFSTPENDDEDGEPKNRFSIKIIGIGIGVLVVGLLAGGFFLKGTIIGMIPAAAGIYEMIGLGGEELGAGLAIQKVKSSRETEQGQEVLIIRGIIANVSDIERSVPMIKAILFDGEGNAVQNSLAAPLKNKLAPNTNVSFKARLVEPSPLARRLEVTFSTGEEEHVDDKHKKKSH